MTVELSEAATSSLIADVTRAESDFIARSFTTQAVQRKIAALANFEIASADHLRATPANCPLRCFGATLRGSTQLRPPSADAGSADEGSHSDAFHSWSRPVTWIATFWSHSWHAPSFQKIVVLLVEYNGLAAAVVGTLAALVAFALFARGILPGMARVYGIYDEKEFLYGTWSVPIGVLFFVLTLLYWRSGKTVFLDKLCISQTDEKKKLEGVLGIGAFLKSSHCLLVLLDSTYVTRLWCSFELAAYTKLMERDPDKTLRFVPLPFGNLFLVVFLTGTVWAIFDNLTNFTDFNANPICLVAQVLGWAPACHMVRNHHNSLQLLSGQLREFTMKDSDCYCCTVGHVHPDTGARISCDRVVVEACVDAWFGSSEAFDAFVQQRLVDKLAQRISSTRVPVQTVVLSLLPQLWCYMDKIAVRLEQKDWHGALIYVGIMLAHLVVIQPLFWAGAWALCRKARRRLTSRCADITVTLGVSIATTAFYNGASNLTYHVLLARPLAIIAFCCLLVIVVLLTLERILHLTQR